MAPNPQQLLKTYLAQQHVMQLSTANGRKPWICSVYYVIDDAFNLYWASWPTRRHSIELAANPRAAAAIAVQAEIGKPVIGIQIEGTAAVLTEASDILPPANAYAKRFGRDERWTQSIAKSKTVHCMYKLVPNRYVLFDEENFPVNTIHTYESLAA